jgi:Ni,Fe-hydrogenase I cytochrome b subunit
MNKNNKKKEEIPDFLYAMKIKTAIYGFILYLLLSNNTAFKILNIIFNNSVVLLNDKNEPSILARLIMAFIIAFCLFIF